MNTCPTNHPVKLENSIEVLEDKILAKMTRIPKLNILDVQVPIKFIKQSADKIYLNDIIDYYTIYNFIKPNIRPLINFNTSNEVLEDFVHLLILKFQSNVKKYSDDINNIRKISIKLKDKIVSNITQIKQAKHIANAITYDDIFSYIYTLRTIDANAYFSLKNVLPIMLSSTLAKFNLSYVYDDKQLWSKDVICLNISERNNSHIGYIYFSLTQSQKIPPITIPILEHWELPSGAINPVVCIVASYNSFTDDVLTYNDIVNLYKQLGNAVQIILNKNKYGWDKRDDELLPHVFEYLAWDKQIFDMHCTSAKLTTDAKNKVLKSHELEEPIEMFNLCINALFDMFIHTSHDFITTLCNNNENNNGNNYEFLTTVYQNMYKSFLDKDTLDLIDLKSFTIKTNLIINLVTRSSYYTWIINKILAYEKYLELC